MADTVTTRPDVSEARERMNRIAATVKERTSAKLVSILSRYSIDSSTAAQIADEIYTEYQAISREVHKEIMGI